MRKPLTEEQKEAKRLYFKNYNLLNKEKIKKQKELYYLENKENKKIYYLENKEKIIKKNVERYQENKEDLIIKSKKWRDENLEKQKEYREKNKDKIKKYYIDNKTRLNVYKNNWMKNKIKNDILYKLKHNIKSNITQSIKRKGFKKKSKTQEILGISILEFKSYLESKFETWMTWDNYGKYNGELNYGWDIDHIITSSSTTTENELLKLNHFSNLQPLCSKNNRDIKKNNIN